MNELPIKAFKEAIRAIHGAPSRLVRRAAVSEHPSGERVWQGEVLVFALEGHAAGIRCYAWEENGDITVVLHDPPVDSPEAAVRAAIALHQGVPEAC